MNHFPEPREKNEIANLKKKSQVLYLGIDTEFFDALQKSRQRFRQQKAITKPLILWNHRWEYDKNPQEFFELLCALKKEGISFQLAILGEQFHQRPGIFEEMQTQFEEEIVQFGFVESKGRVCEVALGK